jgi:outer membrane protein assembly factor BamB
VREPKSQAVFAALEFSSDPMKPMAFGGAASNVIAGFDYLLTEMWRANTTFPVYAEARISPDDETVYFVEQNGRVHAIEATTGKVRWSAASWRVFDRRRISPFSKSGKILVL